MPNEVELITVPVAIQTRNKLDQMHWAVRHRLKKQYSLLVRSQMNLNKIKKANPGDVYKLSILTFRKYRIRDYDNLVGGCKQLLDALTDEAFIWDDDTKFIGKPKVRQEQSKIESTIISRVLIKKGCE
tara:strand:- start:965 stop:1348 length:384 start_codon:yes stop_codon:yes gene_type:complete